MKELELRELLAKHRSDNINRDSTINSVSLIFKFLLGLFRTTDDLLRLCFLCI